MAESPAREVSAEITPSTVERIVVPLDGSVLAERALGVATHLAQRTGASVHPLTVLPPVAGDEPPADLPDDVEVVHDLDPARAIVTAASQPATLLSMATHGRGRIGSALLGSVTESVLRRHDRPTLLVGPRAEPRDVAVERVMVCLDGSRLAEAILPVAERWARDLSTPLELVQVLPTDIDRILAQAGVVEGDVLESSYVDGLARRLEDADWEVLRDDDPVDALVGHATPGTLVALATHGRGGLSRLVMGSVAMRLAHRSPHPLLVLRPTADDTG